MNKNSFSISENDFFALDDVEEIIFCDVKSSYFKLLEREGNFFFTDLTSNTLKQVIYSEVGEVIFTNPSHFNNDNRVLFIDFDKLNFNRLVLLGGVLSGLNIECVYLTNSRGISFMDDLFNSDLKFDYHYVFGGTVKIKSNDIKSFYSMLYHWYEGLNDFERIAFFENITSKYELCCVIVELNRLLRSKFKSLDVDCILLYKMYGEGFYKNFIEKVERNKVLSYFFSIHKINNLKHFLRLFGRFLVLYPLNDNNKTIALVEENKYEIYPYPLSNSKVYEAFYKKKDETYLNAKDRVKLLIDSFSHDFRYSNCSAAVEYLLSVLSRTKKDSINYLDIGCGDGAIVDLVRPEKFGVYNYSIKGFDFSVNKLKLANFNNDRDNVKFYYGNAFELKDDKNVHLVSMFEFLEHLEDPVSFISEVKERIDPDFIIAGSPYLEKLPARPTNAHLFSFGEDGFKALFEQAGYHVVTVNISKIGRFHKRKNHDWIYCIASKNTELSGLEI